MSTGASPGLTTPAKTSGYLNDRSDHIWRTASVPVPSAKIPGDYRAVITRIPAKLDPALMKEPRAIQGVPRPDQGRNRGVMRKKVPSSGSLSALQTAPAINGIF
jgi:hypothetical protein